MGAPLPLADYYLFVGRAEVRPYVDVWPVGLRQPLPTVPIPLRAPDPDVDIDLQRIFTEVYDAAGYDYTLDYTRALQPPLSAEDAAWAAELLREARKPEDGSNEADE